MGPAIPPPARRAYRLALGLALGIAAGFASDLPLPFVPAVLAVVVLAAPAPPPGGKAILVLLLLLAVTSLGGLLIGQVIVEVRVAGVLLMLLAVGAAGALSTRPGMMVPATFVILGTTIVGAFAAQSQTAGLAMAKMTGLGWIWAFAIAHIGHLLFPEDGPPPPRPAGARALPAGWVGIRAAVVMLPPILLALIDLGTFMLLLLKGSTLAQQPAPDRARRLAMDTVTSTLLGGLVALAVWQALKLWPTLPMFSLLMGLAGLLLARPLFGVVRSRARPDHWQNTLVTLVVIVGPAVGDSAVGDDIAMKAAQRLLMFMALSLYAAFAVHALDSWYLRHRSRQATAPIAA